MGNNPSELKPPKWVNIGWAPIGNDLEKRRHYEKSGEVPKLNDKDLIDNDFKYASYELEKRYYYQDKITYLSPSGNYLYTKFEDIVKEKIVLITEKETNKVKKVYRGELIGGLEVVI